MNERARDIAVVLGALCVSIGFGLAWLPAGVVVWGAFLIALGLGAAR